MIATMLMMLAMPQADAMISRAADRLSVKAAPAIGRDGKKWRIDPDMEVEDGKERALGTTGAQCQVVGARMCTRKPRTVLSRPIDPR